MTHKRSTVILFHKPYGVLSQFTRKSGEQSLANFGPFPPDVYPVGRLDADSEGLLLLTNDNALKHRLTSPQYGHTKTYLVQIERIPDKDALEQLRKGVMIQGKKTRPAEVRIPGSDPAIPERSVPVRFRKSVPTAWLEITLTEGRNRQIRHMTAAVGHATLRLVRIRIGALELGSLKAGESRKLTTGEVERLTSLA
ncbi:MAG: pseudouridine synthase [Bacteroidota bacterium]